MLKNFRTYDFAVSFYRTTQTLKLPGHIRDQLSRAAASIVANLQEGNGRSTVADKRRMFHIAMGSLRECQGMLDISPVEYPEAVKMADQLGAAMHCLIERVIKN